MREKSASRWGMKRAIMILFVVFMTFSGIVSASNVMVTFRVNMKTSYPANGVYIGSDWAGWSFEKFQKMTDTNNDSIFELTVYLPAGYSYNYRYTKSNLNWGNFESLAGTPCGFGPSHEDRNILVPEVNTVLDVVCWDDCLDCGSTLRADLSFSVDMSGLTVSPDGVHVAGTFDNWNATAHELTDPDNDHIYQITMPVIPNLSYEYKFLNGKTLSTAEEVFGTCEFRGKRRVSVHTDPVSMPLVKFGSCNESGAPISDIKIACIGNSITEGGAGNYVNSWPIQLRDLLGEGYYTENLGVSGTTMSKYGDSPWWNQPQYDYTFNLNPDVVVIKLGTNDSKSGNWKPDKYLSSYVDMINEFRAMPSHPTIYMVTPAKAYSAAYDISDNTIVMKIIPIMHQIAFDHGVHVIDMYNATSNMQALFPDGIHPNADGAKVIAQKVKENILRAKPIISVVEPTTDTASNILYHWYFNDNLIPGENRRTINVSENGSYKVSVRLSNLSNDIFVSDAFNLVIPQGSTTVGLTTDYEAVLKVDKTLGSRNILIYPNPASSSIRIENAADSDVTIFNELGSVVMTQEKIDSYQTIEIPDLRNGVYFVRLSQDNSSVTQRIVVAK